MAKNDTTFDRTEILNVSNQVLQDELGYPEGTVEEVEGESCLVVRVGTRPVIMVYVPENPGPIIPSDEELLQELSAVVNKGPADYAWATSEGVVNDGYIYSWLDEHQCQLSEIPPFSTDKELGAKTLKPNANPIQYKELQAEFNDLHEQVYALREPVDSSNDLTAQLCKLIFLKMHLEHHPDFKIPGEGKPLLSEVFTEQYIRSHKKDAIDYIKECFNVVKNLDEYCQKDDQGNDFRIFDPEDFIKFTKVETYVSIAAMLNKHQLTSPEESGLENDILGRAFDVMLRAKFEGKGGMGVYLTPEQVRNAMVEMAFYDILKEDPQSVTRKDPSTGKTTFRVLDPCCGSAGFLVTSMKEVRKHVNKLLGLTEKQRNELIQDIYSNGFVGSDNAPNMVLMARMNMALHGDPMARAYRVDNSLTTDVLVPESFDLIVTNPPFKKGGVKRGDGSGILESFATDIDDEELLMTGDGLALGCKPNSKGKWKPIKSIDPAVLFIDRCLQLLKPGGRLLIVLPDGILCNSGDKYVREYLMGKKDEKTGRFIGGKAVVKAVVSLPPVTFRLSGAGAKTSFLYLQKKRPGDEQGPVFMAVAEDVGFDVKQNKEILTGGKDLVKIVESYKSGPRQED